jgi:hypothetical protein
LDCVLPIVWLVVLKCHDNLSRQRTLVELEEMAKEATQQESGIWQVFSFVFFHLLCQAISY